MAETGRRPRLVQLLCKLYTQLFRYVMAVSNTLGLFRNFRQTSLHISERVASCYSTID